MVMALHRTLCRAALIAGAVITLHAAAVSRLAAQTQDSSKVDSSTVDWTAYEKSIKAAPRDTIPQEAYTGWKQFELNCSRCHGEFGVGTSFAPALVESLKKDGTVPTKEAFIQVVCAGRKDKGMPSWCELGLGMDKIQQIYAYLKGRADGEIHAGRPAVKPES